MKRESLLRALVDFKPYRTREGERKEDLVEFDDDGSILWTWEPHHRNMGAAVHFPASLRPPLK